MDDAPILICYDDSPESRHAVDIAARLFPGRDAVILDVAPFLTAAESIAETSLVAPDFGRLNEDEALTRARAGATLALERGLQAKPRADLDTPTWQGVVDVADEIRADVIVIGTRAHTGARRLLEGSVSQEVAEHARRPVLIVPPPPTA
jgi:nucleotide-binding universal stress UspA family protein